MTTGSGQDRTRSGAADERGVATVWAAGAITVLLTVVLFVFHLGGVIVARHHAQSAADLAALAGAGGVLHGEQYACAQARRVTDRMRVRLTSCRASGWQVFVEVAATSVGGYADSTGRARAGPVAVG